MTTKKKGWFYYGWVVVGIAFLTMAFDYLIRYSYPVFFEALQEEFGWSRTQITFAFTMQMMFYGMIAPFAGALYDKFGPRRVFPLAACVVFAAMLGCSQIRTLWQWYLFGGILIPLGTIALGVVPHTALVSSWFVKKRGTAWGIAVAGTGVGQFASGVLVAALVSGLGFRWSYAILGIIVLAMIFPLTLLFQRQRPEERGLLPDGEGFDSRFHDLYLRIRARIKAALKKRDLAEIDASEEVETVVNEEWARKEWTLRMIVRTYQFWVFFIGKILLIFGVYCVLINQIAYAIDLGFSKVLAAGAFGAVGFVRTFGKIFWGFISDRIGREVTYTILLGLAALGIVALINVRDPSQVWLLYTYSILYGFGYGSISAVLSPMLADLFGPNALGKSYGLSVLGSGLGGALGPLFGAYVFDATGSYRIAFAVALVVILTSLALIWLAAPRKVRLVEGRARARAAAIRKKAALEEVQTAKSPFVST